MSKKLDKDLLNEEVKKHMRLVEYTFYMGEDDEFDKYSKKDDLILGEVPEDEVDADVDAGGEEELDLPVDGEAGDEETAEFSDEDPVDAEADIDADIDVDAEIDAVEEPAEDEVELDVTQLVQGQEEVNAKADEANAKVEDLLTKFDELMAKVDGVEAVGQKIDSLENEMEKRMPTEPEKLEMRSLDSYPYNLKLTDYWAEKDGQYDVMDTDEEGNAKPEEYILTQNDVDSDYNTSTIRDTFDDDDEYEEEEIDGKPTMY